MLRPAVCATFVNFTPTPSSVLVWPDTGLPTVNKQKTTSEIQIVTNIGCLQAYNHGVRVRQATELERNNDGSQERQNTSLLDSDFRRRNHHAGAGWNGQVALKKIRSEREQAHSRAPYATRNVLQRRGP